MARWAIGDVQGCCEELEALLARIGFSADRDQLWLVGDLVNRGPRSLAVLRLVRSLGDAAICVLGNHDLHLLAVALAGAKLRKSDTLADILVAPDRDALLEWLCRRPLAHFQPAGNRRVTTGTAATGAQRDDAMAGDLLVHAGVVPQWTVAQTLSLAGEVEQALRSDARGLLSQMYGDEPDRWRDTLSGPGRLRLAVNVLTRLRFCTAAGRVDLKHKGKPDSVSPPLLPWFLARERASRAARVVFGHWSALGLYRADGLLGLDTGCVWGGALTAVDLDRPDAVPVSVASRQPRSIED
ncbi:MAG TPA: symmetrical bis(5'-nucleosyl)-tetraphosphatase [Steroidobacteraceae bacterium]|jgi:bis(5'-nucleosyl)-tetraphosphatase (symmetrical)|nr:symmetrical bis(5'-nucleosyl)-tetraphosphatase [Steroidobacteraceae bacterium]